MFHNQDLDTQTNCSQRSVNAEPMQMTSHDFNDQRLDLVLLPRIRAGDEDAFETMFRMAYDPLCKFVASFRPLDPSAAEEIVQSLLTKVWNGHEHWRPAGGARAYLFGAARNGALNGIRRRRFIAHATQECVTQGEIPGMANTNPDPITIMMNREVETRCRQSLGQLPESNRLAMALHWLYRMEYAEIAFVLGTSIKGIEAHITRGLRTLSASLSSLRVG